MTPAQRATNLPCHADARRSLLGDGRALLAPVSRCTTIRASPRRVDEGQESDAQRYYYQGIGGFEADVEMARGLAIRHSYVHGDRPTSIDADIYGFVANICFYDIETPLKEFVVTRGADTTLPCHLRGSWYVRVE